MTLTPFSWLHLSRYKPVVWDYLWGNDEHVKTLLIGEVLNLDSVLEHFGLHGMQPASGIAKLVSVRAPEEFLPLLNGSFLWLTESVGHSERWVATDRFATIRLFYTRSSGEYHFCDSLWDLAQKHTVCQSDIDSVIGSMLFGYFIGKRTCFKGVYEVEPGRVYRVNGPELTESKYWHVCFKRCTDIEYEQAAMELHDRWLNAVDRWVSTRDDILVPISGGMDSRALLAALIECGYSRRITTCTWGPEGSFDFEFGNMISRKAGTRHVILPSDFADWKRQCETWQRETEGMLNCLPHFPVLHYERTIRDFRYVMIGYMGDPSMGSHLSADMIGKPLPEQLALVQYLIERHRWSYVGIGDVQSLFQEPVADRLSALVGETLSSVEGSNLAEYCEAWDFHQRQHKFTPYAVFRFVSSVRYLTPFTDNEVFDFMCTMPVEWRQGQRLYFHMLGRYFQSLFSLPSKNYLGLPITATASRLGLQRFLYRGRRFVQDSVLRKPRFSRPATNYLEYDHLLPVHEPLRRYLSQQVDEYLRSTVQIGDPNLVKQVWNMVSSTPSSKVIPLTMLLTHQMTLDRIRTAPQCSLM